MRAFERLWPVFARAFLYYIIPCEAKGCLFSKRCENSNEIHKVLIFLRLCLKLSKMCSKA